jgi:hypothetical protein
MDTFFIVLGLVLIALILAGTINGIRCKIRKK